MAFHYTRKYGSEGILQRTDGLGTQGESLRRFSLHHDLPLRACLEILAFIADIISDAMKNGHFHGDIKSENINILQDGSIILNGYGRPRRQTLAPENTLSIPGDVYSLGVVMLELLSGQADLELPLEENLHNQKVLEVFLSINWKEWSSEPFLPNMQEYLISLLFFDPSSRPHPLDVANILSEALQTTRAPSLPSFISQNNITIQNHKEQLSGASTLRNSLMTPVEVTADSSQGVATGFWSRDKIAKMFETDLEEDKAVQEEWAPPPQIQSSSPPQQQNFSGNKPQLAGQHPTNNERMHSPSPLPDRQEHYQPYQRPDYQNPGIPLRREETTSDQPPSLYQAPQPDERPPLQQQFNSNYQQPKQLQPEQFSQQEITAPPTLPDAIPSLQNQVRREPPIQHHQSSPLQHQNIPAQQLYQQQSRSQQVAAFSIGAGNQHDNIGTGQQATPQFSQGAQHHPATQTPQFSAGQQSLQHAPAGQAPHYSGSAQPMTGGANKKLLVILGGAGLFCLLLMTGVAIAFMATDQEEEPERKIVPIEEPSEPEAFLDEETEEDPPEEKKEVREVTRPKEVVRPKTTTRKTTTRKTTTRKTATRKTTSPKTITKTAEPIIANSNFQVQVKFREKNASISCGDGQQKEFSGIITLTFTSPQSCRIDLEDGTRGAFVARQEGSINCKLDGSNIICR